MRTTRGHLNSINRFDINYVNYLTSNCLHVRSCSSLSTQENTKMRKSLEFQQYLISLVKMLYAQRGKGVGGSIRKSTMEIDLATILSCISCT